VNETKTNDHGQGQKIPIKQIGEARKNKESDAAK
jgi:hypothetical protein